MRGFEVPQPAVLDERHPAARELQLEHVAVVRRAHQHGLGAQLRALLARLQHARADLLGLRRFVAHMDHARALAAARSARSRFGNAREACAATRVGGVQHGLRGAVVALQRHDARPAKCAGKSRMCSAEAERKP